MKKIYLSLFTIVIAFTASAQITLTKAFNEPVVGDINTRKGYDSTTTLPNTPGAGQNWNFSSITSNTVSEVFTYTPAASTPSASAFPGATIAEDDGAGGYNYFKTTASTYEMMGFSTAAGSSATFSNSGIIANWPVSFGYTGTDTYAGTVDYLSLIGPGTGTITASAPGSGTLTLPGSIVFNNCLQFKIVNKANATIGSFPLAFTITTVATDYQYYAGTQKFPILVVSYNSQTLTSSSGPSVTDAYGITVNNNVLTGINDVNFDAINYKVYPNPATDAVNINLSNDKNEDVSVIVTNSLGQVVKSVELGNATEVKRILSTTDLSSGVYYIKTSVGDRSTTKKLIIQ